MKNILEMTKTELNEISYQKEEGTWFNGFIVIPTSKIHDSGWRCMKFILLQDGSIVGCIGGGSDVVALIKHNWRVDCLPKSKLLRFFNDKHYTVSDFCIGSDFLLN